MLKHFEYEHLPPALQEVSKPFCELARDLCDNFENVNEWQGAQCLQKLLEAKDAAVRMAIEAGALD